MPQGTLQTLGSTAKHKKPLPFCLPSNQLGSVKCTWAASAKAPWVPQALQHHLSFRKMMQTERMRHLKKLWKSDTQEMCELSGYQWAKGTNCRDIWALSACYFGCFRASCSSLSCPLEQLLRRRHTGHTYCLTWGNSSRSFGVMLHCKSRQVEGVFRAACWSCNRTDGVNEITEKEKKQKSKEEAW